MASITYTDVSLEVDVAMIISGVQLVMSVIILLTGSIKEKYAVV